MLHLSKDPNVDCCQNCGFIPCICKYVIGYEHRTGFSLLKVIYEIGREGQKGYSYLHTSQ